MQPLRVASFTGAWIETLSRCCASVTRKVASFTGAWIETSKPMIRSTTSWCRLLHGGVDRNVKTNDQINDIVVSPPSRGRGSKHERSGADRKDYGSPPSRGRG